MTAVHDQEVHQKAAPKKAVRELKRLHTSGRNQAANLLGCGCGCGCDCGCDCIILPPER
jgi:hypothetical protein